MACHASLVSGSVFLQMFREKLQLLDVQVRAGGLTSTSELFLQLEAAAADDLCESLTRTASLSTAEITQLLEEMMTSHFRSATRSRLQAAFSAKHTTMYMPPSNGAKVMLGFQYLIYICIDPFMVQFKYCLCFASQETASVAAPIVLIDQKAASEHHSVGACSVSQVGEPSSMFIRWASHPQ